LPCCPGSRFYRGIIAFIYLYTTAIGRWPSYGIFYAEKTVISFRQVDFTHSGQGLFTGLTFHLQKGRYLVISGPARSGKTTLVKMIAGMLIPTAGEIIIDGESMESVLESRTKLRQLRRKVGGVGGIYSLLTELTILENIALSAEIAGLSPRAARGRSTPSTPSRPT
jgi:ABC-type ATPase involved in cell division